MLKENLPVMASSEYDKGNLCFADGTHRDATSHYILAIKNYLQYAYRKLDDKNKLPVTFGELWSKVGDGFPVKISREMISKLDIISSRDSSEATPEDAVEIKQLATSIYLRYAKPDGSLEGSIEGQYASGCCALENGDYCSAIKWFVSTIHWYMQIIAGERGNLVELWKKLPPRAKAIISEEKVVWCENFKPEQASKETARELDKVVERFLEYTHGNYGEESDVDRLRKLVPPSVAESYTDEELLENFGNLL